MKNNKKDTLGDRQKSYEKVTDTVLVPKMPYIIRLDGVAFHTFTKGFDEPFDCILSTTMDKTCKSLCEDIPYVVAGYVQSDEITLLCKYPDIKKSEAWYGGRVSKMQSIAASRVTRYFDKHLRETIEENLYSMNVEKAVKLRMKFNKAEFDCRVFNIPEWDLLNNLIWRQNDCIRNSIQSIGQCVYSAKELNEVSMDELKYMLAKAEGIIWEDIDPRYKYGALYLKDKVLVRDVYRTVWNKNCLSVLESREYVREMTGVREDD